MVKGEKQTNRFAAANAAYEKTAQVTVTCAAIIISDSYFRITNYPYQDVW
jgi:hypothetical protein